MNIQALLETKVKEGFSALFDTELPSVEFQATRKDFEGDITVVVFPMLRYKKGNPVQIGEELGSYLKEHVEEIKDFNVVKGFLNLVVSDTFYINFFNGIATNESYGFVSETVDAMMVEYSSPNTNKPLHLGHIRNNLLGYSVAEILKAAGKKVYKTQIINDRGIHICKSMLAWKKYGNGETPESTGLKGDKLVGNYYVKFDQEYKKEIAELVASGVSEEDAKKQAPSLVEAQNMLRKWESGDAETVALWKTMNGWVYEGFDITYKNLGVDFDALYYESDTYLLGKDVIADGLTKGVFFTKEDGSVWCDLTDEGLDEKLVLRSDGTAVYMTQDIGTAIQRVKDYSDINGMVYTVGNEQDYHFKVLFLILKKLGFSWAEQLYHLSYGMVDLPSGKMKSREGTVVDADDLMIEMANTARDISQELGKLDGYSDEEKNELYKMIGLGALKYFILKVDPKKRILFDPQASVDFQGNTGPFVQYTYARIQSILRKADFDHSKTISGIDLHEKEKELIKQLEHYPEVIQQAAANYSPALIANYTYDLVKEFNSFYQNVSILGEANEDQKIFRVQLSKKVADTIKSAFSLLGIQVPNRM
ncbi:arginine--tRNA ligase [Pseudotenacibaculum haliotis]|uniref:Arginine--tRNA ligase n=1 Tax=Pseudotenacibaculum haliotis TaxID=1862138 RepID=A0ABW5LN32_9FLAO